jgi:hypothetical protein
MSTIAGLLFPWRKTFKQLELRKLWWHRLALVLFCIALILLLAISTLYTFAANSPYPSSMPNIRFWTVDSNGNENDLPYPPTEASQIAPEVPQSSDSDDALAKRYGGTTVQQQQPAPPTDNSDLIFGAAPPATPDKYNTSHPPEVAVSPPVHLDFSKAIPIHASVEMPNAGFQEFVGKSPREIKADWNKKLHKAVIEQWFLGIGVPIVLTLFFSYLFQSLYRALLFVIYGSKTDALS